MQVNLPALRSYRVVRARFIESRTLSSCDAIPDLPWKTPRAYRSIIASIGPQELAGDYRIPSGTAIEEENTLSDYPKLQLGLSWMVFALSGTGDAWILRLGSRVPDVAFVDHDQAQDAKPILLGLNLKSWLQLAYLMRELEQLEKAIGEISPDIADHVRKELDRLSPGLSTRYPYKL